MDAITTNRNLLIHGLFQDAIPFDTFANLLPTSFAVLDTRKSIIFLNQSMEALTGFSINEAMGIPCRHILRCNLCGTKCPVLSLSVDSEPACHECNIISRDRTKRPVRVTYAPITDDQGCFFGWLQSVENIVKDTADSETIVEAYSFGTLVSRSPQMERLFHVVSAITQTNSSVLVTGETGTGKDVLAEIMHNRSERAKGAFVKINCGALPETLLESELFGHQKGAFTGATENKAGRFKLAHNGTLFLTEIGDLPLPIQVKLLSFLDDHVIYPLGTTKGTQVDVRLMTATNRDLHQMARDGSFREDLLFRLNVVRIHLPPLREREGDTSLLLDYFLRSYMGKFKKTISGFSKDAMDLLLSYPYPGNVRELKNIVEFAVNFCQDGLISLEHLPNYICDGWDINAQAQPLPDAHFSAQASVQPPDRTNWSDMERDLILKALLNARGKRQEAAEILGWGRSTLWRKMKQYKIDG